MIVEALMFDHLSLDCSGLSAEQILTSTRDSIAEHRLAYLRNFPLQVDAYVELLEQLGQLCPNYAAGSTTDAYSLHPAVNVVRCRPPASDGSQRVQAKAGSLPMHSGRSFARRRPLYLAMCMTDPGWRDFEVGHNGESLIVRWGDVLATLRERHPEHWARDLRLLTGYSFSFPASHLDEAASELPFIYTPGTRRPNAVLDDVAVRLPQDLGRLRQAATRIKDGESWFEAVARFAAVANQPGMAYRYVMSAGDVVILDNDRYGHGRCEVIATREDVGGAAELNPRSIWSVNIQ
jgi:alpha-ketoglutarate-dependent taurine dioxygenase